ncbi:hypothetical protein FRC02_008406 [Tulasnella sp. 418]|nr:hypothetical protein FRC02_008406 [Tulasnella sp. 418]
MFENSNLRNLVVLALLAAGHVSATQVMHRPDNYKSKKTPNTVPHNTTFDLFAAADVGIAAGGKVNMAYFTNWGIYGRAYYPQAIPASKLTHILYSFADTRSDGTVFLTDTFADQEKHYDGDSWSESGLNVYGNFKQLYLLKKANRNLKVMLSIGGWTYSQANHFDFVTNSGYRANFVSSAIQLLEDNGLDGIDIDYEYPDTTAEAAGLSSLLTELRAALNSHASKKGDSVPYQVSAAVAAGPDRYNIMGPYIAAMDKALTYWNLMAYDYSGSWSTVSDDQANLFGGSVSGVSTKQAIDWYVSKGATKAKISMGMPLYGRAFENTNGIRQPFNGIGPGTWEAGIYDYKALPLPGAKITEDTTNVASYSYDSAKKELVSYDTPNIIRTKSNYIISQNLAGGMFWELSSDKTGSESLVDVAKNVFGALDSTQNHLNYPGSKYDNIKNQMGSTQPGTTTTGPQPTGGTGGCSGVAAWVSATAYTGGQKVTYGGRLWQAKWWTQAETPGSSSG